MAGVPVDSFRGMRSLFMSGFEVLGELWERVLTSLSAHSLVSAAVSPGEADIFRLSSTLLRFILVSSTLFLATPQLFFVSLPLLAFYTTFFSV